VQQSKNLLFGDEIVALIFLEDTTAKPNRVEDRIVFS
jgi:hypothetical protein